MTWVFLFHQLLSVMCLSMFLLVFVSVECVIAVKLPTRFSVNSRRVNIGVVTIDMAALSATSLAAIAIGNKYKLVYLSLQLLMFFS